MMAQFGFDTLSFVKRLSAAGMDSRQAEALAEALAEHPLDALATSSVLKSDLREFEVRLTLRMGAIAVASVAILATLIAAS